MIKFHLHNKIIFNNIIIRIILNILRKQINEILFVYYILILQLCEFINKSNEFLHLVFPIAYKQLSMNNFCYTTVSRKIVTTNGYCFVF